MTMEAARARAKTRGEVARLAAELAQVRAERDWLADRLVGTMDCPHYPCPTHSADACDFNRELAHECWLKAAAAATKPKEVTT